MHRPPLLKTSHTKRSILLDRIRRPINFALGLCLFACLSTLAPGQEGSGNQFGVVDAWEGNSTKPPENEDIYRLGKVLTVKVANLDGWLMTEVVSKRLDGKLYFSDKQLETIASHLKARREKQPEVPLDTETRAAISKCTWDMLGRLYPVVDGIGLKKAARLAHRNIPRNREDTLHLLRFVITRDSSESPEWANLLKTSDRVIRPTLTLAYDDPGGLPPRHLPSWVGEGSSPSYQSLQLEIYGKRRMVMCVIAMAIILSVLLWFAPKSEILRDPNQPLRPDGTYPWSLSRAQMAFWFILVASGFLFLWVITDQIDVLNNTSLILIGIGSATALGTAAISHTTRDEEAIRLAELRYGGRKGTSWKSLKANVLARLHGGFGDGTHSNPIDEEERAFFSRGWLTEILNDWLTENKIVSFHRFQMLAWTLVLGLVFVFHVVAKLELPEFDPTLLGLTGISAGTYLGFKFPATAPPPPSPSIPPAPALPPSGTPPV